jgi:phosphate transport system protein
VEARRSFHQQLDEVKTDVVRLGALVLEAIPQGTAVLLDGDVFGAQLVIDADDVLDELELAIEDRCFHLLALQAPVASDMRALVTAIRLASELERSGDLVVNIAKGARRMQGTSIDPRTRGLIQQLSDEASRLFGVAMYTYADGDEVMAASLNDMDDLLDALHREFIAQILESCRAGHLDVQAAVQLALIGRYYERIGDHAVNVGERVRYMVTGALPERPDRVPPSGPPA